MKAPLAEGALMFELRVHVESLRHGDGRRWRAKVESAAGSTRWITVPHLTAPVCRSIPAHAAASWADFLAHCAPNETTWTPPPGVLKEVGAAVWRELFATADFPAQLERARARAGGEPLRVALVLEDDGGEKLDAALFDCPFELAYRTDPGGFVFHTQALPAVRVVSGPDERNAQLGAGARVAIVTAHEEARPEPTPEQLDSHASSLEAAVRGCGWTPVLLPDATPADVERLLRAPERLDVLYVVCHGEDDPNRSGRLALRGGGLTGEQLGALLAERTGLRLDPVQLVVLVACSSARPLVRRWSAGMAEWVARCGRAVAAIGFQADMSVAGGLLFGERLLRELCAGAALEPAFAAARQSVPEPEWALPLLYTRLLDRNAAPPDHGRRPRAPELPPLRAPLPRTAKPTFTGRERELGELRAWLERSETAVVTSVEGQGGIGKSELAAVLAHEARTAGREVLWLERPGRDLRAALVALLRARTPDLQVAPERSDEDLVADLRRELGPYDGLLVLDDVEAARDLDALRPGAGWSLLVTTRQPDLVPGGRRLELGPLSPAEALTLLSRLAWGPDEPPPEHRAAAEELVETLGRVPLHLELAGATLRTTLVTPGEYRAALLAGTGVAQADLAQVRARVFERTLAGLGPAERETFLALGVFPACGVRAEHVAWGFDEPEPVVTRRLDRLVRHRLVAFSPETGRYGLHPLARAVAREGATAVPAMWDRLRGVVAKSFGRIVSELRGLMTTPTRVRYGRWATVSDLFDSMGWEDWRGRGPGSPNLSLALSVADGFRQLSWTLVDRRRTCDLAVELAGEHRLASAAARQRRSKVASASGDRPVADEDFEIAIELFVQLGDRIGEANCLLERGDHRQRLDDLDAAELDFERAMRLFRESRDLQGEANTRLARVAVRRRLEDLNHAAQDCEAALELFRKLDDLVGQANTHLERADLGHRLGDIDGAAKDYDRALALFQRLGARAGLAAALLGRARLRLHRNDLVGAEADSGDSAVESLDRNDPLGEAQALLLRGQVRLRRNDLLGASHDLEVALGLFTHLGTRLGLASTHQARGDLRRRSNDLDGAAQDLDTALGLYEHIEDRLGQGNTLLARGALRDRQGESSLALADYDAALALYEKIGLVLGAANTLRSRGDLRRRLGELAGAERDFEAALPLHMAAGDLLGRANTLLARATLWLARGDIPGAERDVAEAFGLYEQVGDYIGQTNALRVRAQTAIRGECLEAALAFYRRAEESSRATGDDLGRSSVLAELAALHASTGAAEEARPAALEAKALALRCGNHYALRLAASVAERLDPPPTAARAPNPAPTEG